VSDDLLVDVLRAWESWTGQGNDFAKEIGVNRHQFGIFIKKGRKLVKSGKFSEGDFKEIKFDSIVPCSGAMAGSIEVSWESGKVIRFSQVEQLVDFLKKVA
jgi:hypothetical protein